MIRETWIKGEHEPWAMYAGSVTTWVSGDVTARWHDITQRYTISKKGRLDAGGWVKRVYRFKDVEPYLK
jgi:hypothetical protein